jgi:amidase
MPDFDPSLGYMPYADVTLAPAPTGPLAGLTFAVKDLFDVAGMPTSGGNPLLAQWPKRPLRFAHQRGGA